MRTIVLCGLCTALLVTAVWGGQPARIGSEFADVYSVFAPLGVLHRSYADFLFYGSDVVIPEDLASACEETGYLLALLHIDLLTQTDSQVAETIPRLARLRADLAAFCDAFSGTLAGISLMDPPDLAILKDASELGLFSSIYGLQQGLQFTFEAYLDGSEDEESTWEFAVAFALKTLLDQEELGVIEANLRHILYGSEEAMFPPKFIPPGISIVITQLVEFIDIPLEASMIDEIRALAQLIYNYVVGEP